MKKTSVLFSLLIAICFCSCQLNNRRLASLNDYFTNDYAMGLESIISFFEQKISMKCNYDRIEDCYIIHCKKVEEQIKDDDLAFDTTGLSELIHKSKIVDELWILSEGTVQLKFNGETRKKSFLNLNPNGQYYKFLEKRCLNDKVLSNYFKSVQRLSGGKVPIAFASMIKNCDQLNFKDPTIKTIYAIHWILVYYNYY